MINIDSTVKQDGFIDELKKFKGPLCVKFSDSVISRTFLGRERLYYKQRKRNDFFLFSSKVFNVSTNILSD